MERIADGGSTDGWDGVIGIFMDSVTQYKATEFVHQMEDAVQEYVLPFQMVGGVSNPALGVLAQQNDWTLSIDAGAAWAQYGLMERYGVSFALDHEGGLAVLGNAGSGGTTPVNLQGKWGWTITLTNADSVFELKGVAVQGGGAYTPIGAEAQVFTDSSGETHFGISLGRATVITPLPRPAEIHGSATLSVPLFELNPIDSAGEFSRWLWLGED